MTSTALEALELRVLVDGYSVLRFDPLTTEISALCSIISASSTFSSVSRQSSLFSLSVSPTEISFVLPTSVWLDPGRPSDLRPQATENSWLALRVEPSAREEPGSASNGLPPGIDFGVVGMMARMSGLLAQAKVSIFAISTFDTDYILVKKEMIGVAVRALREDGCTVRVEKPESPSWKDLGLSENFGA